MKQRTHAHLLHMRTAWSLWHPGQAAATCAPRVSGGTESHLPDFEKPSAVQNNHRVNESPIVPEMKGHFVLNEAILKNDRRLLELKQGLAMSTAPSSVLFMHRAVRLVCL